MRGDIPEYNILEDFDKARLIERVNALLRDQWMTQGGICVVIVSANIRLYVQAMIRHYGQMED